MHMVLAYFFKLNTMEIFSDLYKVIYMVQVDMLTNDKEEYIM